jgi:hypothetical protein
LYVADGEGFSLGQTVAHMSSPSRQTDPLEECPHGAIRPTSVAKAVAMLWVTLALGAVRSVVEFIRMANDGHRVRDHVFGQFFIFACLAVLYFFIGRGRNWALALYVVWTILFVAMMAYVVLRSDTEIPFGGVLGIGQAALHFWALALLLQPEAVEWFRRFPKGAR